MINLENTQLVLFDFDDTLCIHRKHSNEPGSDAEYDKRVLLMGSKAWEFCDKNMHMQKFMELCKEKNIRMGLISSVCSHKHAEGKHDWVFEQYGIDLENFCVGTFENKMRIMIAISDAYDIPRNQILLVDDLYDNLERAANNGFGTCTPMEVVNYVYPMIQISMAHKLSIENPLEIKEDSERKYDHVLFLKQENGITEIFKDIPASIDGAVVENVTNVDLCEMNISLLLKNGERMLLVISAY